MRYDSQSMILTILVIVMGIAMLLFMSLKTPLPLPAEEGVLIDFGFTETGRGAVEPSRTSPPPVQKQVESQPVKQEIVTQDIEEAPVLATKKVEKKVTPKETTPVNTQKKTVEEVKKEERKPNPDYSFANYKNSSSSEGQSTGDGNQGKVDGTAGGSHFVGSTGSDGVSFNLDGRLKVNLPEPEFLCQKEGVIVVQITVDRSGKVTDVNPGVKGSTTLDNCLLEAARKAAIVSTFNSRQDAPMYQKGTITYQFKLK